MLHTAGMKQYIVFSDPVETQFDDRNLLLIAMFQTSCGYSSCIILYLPSFQI